MTTQKEQLSDRPEMGRGVEQGTSGYELLFPRGSTLVPHLVPSSSL